MSWRRTRPTADRISLLPDAILCHIFSFLPTKHAVATSVLSKRWYPLWRSVTTLHFTYEHSTKQTYFLFKDFVFSVLLLRDITQPIKSFHLKFGRDSPRDFTNINKWVHSVAQQGLQNLHLDFHSYINLPPSILSCKTLVVLKLSCVVVNALPYVDFPLLKILNLDWVMFWEHGFLMKLLSGCPILEDLQTNNLDMYDKHRSEGVVRSLTKLVRADVSNLFIPFTILPTVEFLRAKLECSYYNDVPEFHSLTHMEIIFSRYDWNWLVGVLNVCPHLQILVLDKDFMVDKKRTFDVNWEDPQIIPECLSSQLRTCTLRNYVGLECELQFAGYIMRNSESLGTMTICSTFSLNSDQKLQILKKLSLCPRRSTTCKLLFE